MRGSEDHVKIDEWSDAERQEVNKALRSTLYIKTVSDMVGKDKIVWICMSSVKKIVDWVKTCRDLVV